MFSARAAARPGLAGGKGRFVEVPVIAADPRNRYDAAGRTGLEHTKEERPNIKKKCNSLVLPAIILAFVLLGSRFAANADVITAGAFAV